MAPSCNGQIKGRGRIFVEPRPPGTGTRERGGGQWWRPPLLLLLLEEEGMLLMLEEEKKGMCWGKGRSGFRNREC